MNFLQYDFLLFFLPLALVLFWIVPVKLRPAAAFLSGLAFAYAWSPLLAALAAWMAAADWFCGRRMQAASGARGRTFFLCLGLASTFMVLVVFRYDAWLRGAAPAGAAGWSMVPWSAMGLGVLSLHSIGYLLSVHRGRPAMAFPGYAAGFAWFPKFQAGPLTSSSDIARRLAGPRLPRLEDLGEGLRLLLLGFAKKAFVADTLAVDVVIPVFSHPGDYGFAAIALASVAASLRFYMDLSGYMDMARGVSFLMGIRLPRSFLFPYLAGSLTAFWARWHRTVFAWFRRHVYNGLGGAARGLVPGCINILVAFLLAGLWLGPKGVFVAFGLLQGLLMAAETAWKSRFMGAARRGMIPRLGGWVFAMAASTVGFALLASPDLTAAMTAVKRLATFASGDMAPIGMVTCLAFAFFLAEQGLGLLQRRGIDLFGLLPAPLRGAAYAAGIAALCLLVPAMEVPFLFY